MWFQVEENKTRKKSEGIEQGYCLNIYISDNLCDTMYTFIAANKVL